MSSGVTNLLLFPVSSILLELLGITVQVTLVYSALTSIVVTIGLLVYSSTLFVNFMPEVDVILSVLSTYSIAFFKSSVKK